MALKENINTKLSFALYNSIKTASESLSVLFDKTKITPEQESLVGFVSFTLVLSTPNKKDNEFLTHEYLTQGVILLRGVDNNYVKKEMAQGILYSMRNESNKYFNIPEEMSLAEYSKLSSIDYDKRLHRATRVYESAIKERDKLQQESILLKERIAEHICQHNLQIQSLTQELEQSEKNTQKFKELYGQLKNQTHKPIGTSEDVEI